MAEPKFLVLAGQYANHLEALPLGNTPQNVSASTEHPLFPATNQINFNAVESCKPWVALLSDEAPSIRFDKNEVVNGGAETGDLTGWEIDDGSPTVGTNPNTGTYSFELPSGASIIQWVPVRAGQKIMIQAVPEGAGGTTHCYASLLETGQVLQPDGTWLHFTISDVDWATETGSYDLKELSPTVPPYDIRVPGGVYTLAIIYYTTGGAGRVDDCYVWHWTDLAAIIGHRMNPTILNVEVYASDDDFSTETLVAPFDPLNWPNTYELFTLRGERFWEIRCSGGNEPDAVWTGQVWLAQKLEFTRAPNMDIEEVFHRELKENYTSGGRRIAHALEDIRRTDVMFTWVHPHEEDFFELRDRLFEAAGFGEHVALIVRADDDPASAHMVYVPKEYRTKFLQTDVEAREVAQIVMPGLSYPVLTQ